jgi:hypothetical protein
MREFVRKQNRLKVLGPRHCFSKIADSTYQFLSLKTMDKVVELDAKARTVTVEAGMTYGHLCPYLDSKGWALHNPRLAAVHFHRGGLQYCYPRFPRQKWKPSYGGFGLRDR